MSTRTILVTGGAGFIGSHFVKHHLKNYPSDQVINFDKLTYAGRLENLKEVEKNPNYSFVKGDICNPSEVAKVMKNVDMVVHFAAESHVDRSIQSSIEFLETNVIGTYRLLEESRNQNVSKFVQISTDEVYGQIMSGSFKETDVLNPRNPYSASKTGADRLAYSFFETHNVPVVITRSSNNYGPNQFPEKLIPLFVTNLLVKKKVPVYGTGKNIRDWLHVEDNCRGIEAVLSKGKNGEVYNIGGENEYTNIEITKMILNELGKGEEMIEYVEDRKGHDFRYALDCSKIKKELDWKPVISFEKGIKDTIRWYQDNEWWWKPLVK
ncbi:MAG: dTDP-glucose 4,6-dehydratase [Candidatus Diapherotrites archaeon]|uniref:dTDP-glucose 4,6-dehydratase n=1 Tax=Candidatus Iainarchaeum sp. TaxID=3101447 RepID=A0A8T4L4C1_9ARCH|nr:dTDP-glucose 4,6-dehydratase [Candidatus Diapherotrites archaeon]